MNQYDLLNQTEIWVDSKGAEHRIADMDPKRCSEVVAKIEGRSEWVTFWRNLDVGMFIMLKEKGGDFTEFVIDPAAWLASRPQVEALKAQAGQV